MSEQARPFRYDDQYRLLDESLVDIKVAAPVVREPDVGGLERIAAGKTALASIPATRAAAAASVPHDLQKEEVKKKLRELLEKKQSKIAAFVDASKLAFMESTGQSDSSATGIVTPSQMMSGNGSATDSRDTSTPREGVHQGPAANLIAAGLKQINSGKV
jgi:hypothetical protein